MIQLRFYSFISYFNTTLGHEAENETLEVFAEQFRHLVCHANDRRRRSYTLKARSIGRP